MAKALVIKGADFFENRVTTVQFIDIPCTGVSLNKSTTSIVESLTEVLTATKIPANTTDAIIWTSSNQSVATVNGGEVSAVSEGTATITATCGEFSASCVVTVTTPVLFAYGKFVNAAVSGSTFNGYATLSNYSGNRAVGIGYSIGGQYPALGDSSYSGADRFDEMYPYPIPEGATKIKVTCPDFGIVFTFFNSTQSAPIPSSTEVRLAALVLDGEVLKGNTPWSISSWTYNTRTIAIPDIPGIDSFIVSLATDNTSAYENFDPSNVTIEFLSD